jgi:hypothetical protein
VLIVGSLRGATAEMVSASREGRRPQPWHIAGIAMAAVPLLVVATWAALSGTGVTHLGQATAWELLGAACSEPRSS